MKSPDETRTFDKGKIELIKIGDASIGRIYLEPGWSWEKCVKPIVKTESCQATHRQYVMSGRVRVKMVMMGVKKNTDLETLLISRLDIMHG